MSVSVTVEDICFACAIIAGENLADILAIELNIEQYNGAIVNTFVIQMKTNATKRIIIQQSEISHEAWVFHFLNKQGLWGWQNYTKH